MQRRCLILVMVLLSFVTGCACYQIGNQGLYRRDIYSVYVPVFESESLRRHLGERLTEAVAKEIELKTPYKLSQGINADSVLYGRIIEENKFAITENINDELRDVEVEFFIEVTWRDRNGQIILGPQAMMMPEGLQEFGQAVHFVPEGGQSLATAQLDAIERLAEQIVAQMEAPW
jgi:hypothetical protein